jgi:EAL domain-containing protein (putative c-di-GMP-specific phosphodiesterase class I)
VKLALDDFGTGYSSLSRLARLPIGAVKIERAFIANIVEEPAGRSMVNSIIELARGQGMSVIAEGVETHEERNGLAELECDFCQGFYFARAMTTTSLESLIEHPPAEPALIFPTRP